MSSDHGERGTPPVRLGAYAARSCAVRAQWDVVRPCEPEPDTPFRAGLARDGIAFERVTGLTLDDFHKLAEVGVFNPVHMDEAIWQFRLFERASLDYLGTQFPGSEPDEIGMWETTMKAPK